MKFERAQARLEMDVAAQLLHDAYQAARRAGYPVGGTEMAALSEVEQRYLAAAAAYEATVPPPTSPHAVTPEVGAPAAAGDN